MELIILHFTLLPMYWIAGISKAITAAPFQALAQSDVVIGLQVLESEPAKTNCQLNMTTSSCEFQANHHQY